MKVDLIVDCQCHLGEGPLWNPAEKRLYWTDIQRGQVFAYDPAADEHSVVYKGETVGGMTLQADGSLLLMMAKGVIATFRDGKVTVLTQVKDSYEQGRRFNDVIAGPAGRVYAGTLSEQDRTGRLYRIDTDGGITTILENVKISNGMAFTLDQRHLYYTETNAWKIYIFDYDKTTGLLTNQRTFVNIPKGEAEGRPDGLTVDAEGYIWSARYEGGAIIRYSPDGIEVERVPIPARKVTSVIFGGEELEDLYVTTAGGQNRSADPYAGALFRLRPGVGGIPEFTSRICL